MNKYPFLVGLVVVLLVDYGYTKHNNHHQHEHHEHHQTNDYKTNEAHKSQSDETDQRNPQSEIHDDHRNSEYVCIIDDILNMQESDDAPKLHEIPIRENHQHHHAHHDEIDDILNIAESDEEIGSIDTLIDEVDHKQHEHHQHTQQDVLDVFSSEESDALSEQEKSEDNSELTESRMQQEDTEDDELLQDEETEELDNQHKQHEHHEGHQHIQQDALDIFSSEESEALSEQASKQESENDDEESHEDSAQESDQNESSLQDSIMEYLSDYFSSEEHESSDSQKSQETTEVDPTKEAFYRDEASEAIQKRIDRESNKNFAKNVVLFVVDNKSDATLRQSRLLANKCRPHNGPCNDSYVGALFYNIAIVKSECFDDVQPDRACAASALFTGVKSNRDTIAVTPDVQYCPTEYESVEGKDVTSLITWAQTVGKRTGLVTSAALTSPLVSPVYAHSCNAHWEADSDIPSNEQRSENIDMAAQLIHSKEGENLNVIYGGGRKNFLPISRRGVRKDGRNLIHEWIKLHHGKPGKHTYVQHAADIDRISPGTENVLGIFSEGTLEGDDDAPELCDMVESSIRLLDREEKDKGYVLIVQQDKPETFGDELEDANARHRQVRDVQEALGRVFDMTSEDDTLVILTSNYVTRLPNDKDRDDKSNESGYPSDMEEFPVVRACNAIETGEDALLMTSGPLAYMFSNVIEQYKVPRIIAYASCMGKGLRACGETSI